MQFTIGGLRVNSASATLQTTEVLSQALADVFLYEMIAEDAPLAIELIPTSVMDDASRTALHDFVTALPTAAGQLEISMTSENGLGFLQVMGGAMSYDDSSGDPEALIALVEQVLTGVTLSAVWTPDG